MGKGNPHRYDSVVVGHNNLQIGEAVCFLLEEPRGGGVLKKPCKLFVDFGYNSLYQHHLRGANMTLTIHLAPVGCSRYIFFLRIGQAEHHDAGFYLSRTWCPWLQI